MSCCGIFGVYLEKTLKEQLMARRPRLDLAGYHHVVNRGVAGSNIFNSSADKKKFLQILCKACKIYDVIVHDYCLMDNHYHLMLETKKENLSLMMRQVNSNYAIYFNKKEKRTGHLWQVRFKSWYIVDEAYLFLLFRYIEHNPLKANLAEKVGQYPYSFAATLIGEEEIIPCAKASMLIKGFTKDELIGFLELELNDDELEALEKERKRKVEVEDKQIRLERSIPLEKHFKNINDKQMRDSAVLAAFEDGYTQTGIAEFLHVTPSLICQIIRKRI